jgi:D-glycero-D-manno-heptose 1,7-bisphosphate phosphatase
MNRPPVFLDRDGTIIVEKHYLCDPDLVELEALAIDGLQALQAQGHPLVVVSNQSGVGRGKFDEAAVHAVNARVAQLLADAGIRIAGWYMCPHAPDTTCDCRKPLPGMALQAQSDLGLDLQGAFVVGDKRSDVELADAIGGTGILVTTGHGSQDLAWAQGAGRLVASDLLQAATLIARQLLS